MADNKTITDGISGTIPVATDQVGGVDYQRVKVVWGADGTATDASAAAPVPVDDDATQTILTALQTVIGATGDAASTGAATLNAHLRSIAAALAGTLTVTGGGGGTQYVEDVASSGGETVTLAGAIRQDSLASSTSATGDFANLKVNANGELYVVTSGSISVTGTMPVSQTAASAALANVSGSASSVTLQASNANRLGLVIVNDSTAILYVKFGSTASTTSYTYFVPGSSGGVPSTLELPTPVYTGIVTGIWASAVGAARVTELT